MHNIPVNFIRIISSLLKNSVTIDTFRIATKKSISNAGKK